MFRRLALIAKISEVPFASQAVQGRPMLDLPDNVPFGPDQHIAAYRWTIGTGEVFSHKVSTLESEDVGVFGIESKKRTIKRNAKRLRSSGRSLLLTMPKSLRIALIMAAYASFSSDLASADYGIHGLGTYVVIMESNAANGALSASDSRRVAAATWSLNLNRSTAAFGRVGDYGPCDLVNEPPAAGNEVHGAVAHHAFVAPSYAFLPTQYQRNYVRAALVGLNSAVNKVLSDPAASADARHRAIAQYLHFAQSIFVQQDESAGRTMESEVFRPQMARASLRRVGRKDGTPADGALRAIAFTHQVTIAYIKSGMLPAVPADDQFEREFFGPPSSGDRARLINTLQSAGIYRYLEVIARVDREGTPTPPESNMKALLATLEQTWTAAHQKGPDFDPPSMIMRDGQDFVDFDAHPDWLVAADADQEMAARRALDEVALAQQAEAMLRSRIDQLTQALKIEAAGEHHARIKLILLGLEIHHRDGAGALKNALASREGPDQRQALGLALSSFQQGQRLVAQIEIDVTWNDPAASVTDRPCFERSPAAIRAFEARLDAMIATLVGNALAATGGNLPASDRERCLFVAFYTLRSVFKGGTVEAPSACQPLVIASRSELALYARSGAGRQDPGIDELLSALTRRAAKPPAR